MRITVHWTDGAKRGRMPGRFATVQEAEDAARAFLIRYPSVTLLSIAHETGGWVVDVLRDEKEAGA